MKIQNEIGDGFLTLGYEELKEKLKELGHRFYSKRAEFIVNSRKYGDKIKDIVTSMHPFEAREWLVRNVKGIGYKEASHFLRNVGYFDFAILDRHVLGILRKYRIVELLKTLTRNRYLEIERKLRGIAEELGMKVGELDLYLWYMKTGKILK